MDPRVVPGSEGFRPLAGVLALLVVSFGVSACRAGEATSGQAAAQERSAALVDRRPVNRRSRHRFLILALLAGPLGSVALYVAADAAAVPLPPVRLDGATLVQVLLIAPVLEELVFRGGVQALLDRTAPGSRLLAPGLTAGNVMTSVLFAAAHLLVAPPLLAAAIFLPSLVFGRVKQLYRSLLPAMLVHAIYNACYLGAGLAWVTRS